MPEKKSLFKTIKKCHCVAWTTDHRELINTNKNKHLLIISNKTGGEFVWPICRCRGCHVCTSLAMTIALLFRPVEILFPSVCVLTDTNKLVAKVVCEDTDNGNKTIKKRHCKRSVAISNKTGGEFAWPICRCRDCHVRASLATTIALLFRPVEILSNEF